MLQKQLKRLLEEAQSRKFYWYAVVCLAFATISTIIVFFTQIPFLNIISILGVIGYVVLGLLSKPKYKRMAAKKMIVPYVISRLVILDVVVALMALMVSIIILL